MVWYRSRYTQLLEAENARLLEENRRLLNIIMPRLGYEPPDQPEKKPAGKPKARRMSINQWVVAKMRDALKTPSEIVLPRPDRKETDGNPVQPA